jgi:sec-independent protein translocase protein TatA
LAQQLSGRRSSIEQERRYDGAMPGFIGVPELIVLAIVLLLIFGPKRLPEIGRSMGKGMREFKESVSSVTGGNDDEQSTTPAPVKAPEQLPAASTVKSDPTA